MTSASTLDDRPSSPAPGGRRRRRVAVAGLVAVVIAGAVAGLGRDGEDAGPPILDELAPGTVTFVAHLDAVTADLDRERERVADAEPGEDSLLALAEVLDTAEQRYAAAPAPAWIAEDAAAHRAALAEERQALFAAYDALRSGEDARAALQRALDARDRATSLAAGLRGTAVLHPDGRRAPTGAPAP